VKRAVLEPAKQYVHNATIPAGQCVRFAAGIEGEGTAPNASFPTPGLAGSTPPSWPGS
jgi:hypothetical protein